MYVVAQYWFTRGLLLAVYWLCLCVACVLVYYWLSMGLVICLLFDDVFIGFGFFLNCYSFVVVDLCG